MLCGQERSVSCTTARKMRKIAMQINVAGLSVWAHWYVKIATIHKTRISILRKSWVSLLLSAITMAF